MQYDSDGFPIVDSGKKDGEKSRIEPLPIVDQSTGQSLDKSLHNPFTSFKMNVSVSSR